MSYPVYMVPAGDVLPIFFDSFDGGTGASITMTGLAVTDIEIYKDGSTTQRASDAGYTLLDTDGIDFDGITGIHGFSIDTGDNTDSGFYAVGSWYHVVVSSVTIDGQTVSFVAAAFRILAAEAVAGAPVVDIKAISGDTGAADNLEAACDGNTYNVGGGAVVAASVTAGVTLANDAISAGKFDESTAFPLKSADTGSTAVARTGADSDTLETLSDQIDNVSTLIPTAIENADALLTRDWSSVTYTGTIRCVLTALQKLRNKVSNADGTLTVYKENDSTSSYTETVTTSESAEPIIAVDPD